VNNRRPIGAPGAPRGAFTGLALLTATALLAAGAALVPSPLWAWLALPLFAAAIVTLARAAPTATVLLAPLIVLRATELASLAAIESGAVMAETLTTGRPTGAATHLLLLTIVIFGASAAVIEALLPDIAKRLAYAVPRWTEHGQKLPLALTALLAAATLTLAILGLRHGIPLFHHIDRFSYLNRLAGTPFASLIHNGALLGPFIGVLLALPGRRRTGALLLAWLLLLSILFGEKFTSLLLILGSTAIAPALAAGRRAWRPAALAAAALIAISLPAILFTYGARADPDRALTRLADRAAEQGQLFYLADRAPPPPRLDTSALAADVASWPDPAVQHAATAGPRFGLYYVMIRFTPSHRLELAVRSGGGFVFPLYPYFLLAGGPLLLFLGALAVALFQSFAFALLARALLAARWLAALAFARVIASLYACLTTGFLWNAFGVKTLATLAIGLVLLRLPGKITVKTISFNAPRQVA
jgi:hypothetical protein